MTINLKADNKRMRNRNLLMVFTEELNKKHRTVITFDFTLVDKNRLRFASYNSII